MARIRPMRDEDVEAAHEVTIAAFDDLAQRRGEPPDPPPAPAVGHTRLRHLLGTDPGGAWVAEDEQGIAGCAVALIREGVWGLSLLIVRPGLQSAGVGSGLLRRAAGYGREAHGRLILSSPDPRALRAYARLGLAVHPCMRFTGTPRAVAEPADVRVGTAADLELTAAIDRHARGGARPADIGTLLKMRQTLLIARERAYAVVEGGTVRTLAGLDTGAAADVLRAVLARAPGEASIDWITGAQQWAVSVCLDAGLELTASEGMLFADGDVGAGSPYLPSGAFL